MDAPDHQSTLEQLTELEQRIERLMGVIALQEETFSELKKKNSDLEEALRNRVESEERYAEEKTIIRSKIDSLLGKLEDVPDAT